jgi:hypothetical protein
VANTRLALSFPRQKQPADDCNQDKRQRADQAPGLVLVQGQEQKRHCRPAQHETDQPHAQDAQRKRIERDADILAVGGRGQVLGRRLRTGGFHRD